MHEHTTAPFGKAYGADQVFAQHVLRAACEILQDKAFEVLRTLHRTEVRLRRAEREHDPRAGEYRNAKRDYEGQQAEVTHTLQLPPMYAQHYGTQMFAQRWVLTVGTVAWKLAQPTFVPLACTAEEIALWVILDEAKAHAELLQEDGEWEGQDASESLGEIANQGYDDHDFLVLYDGEAPDEHMEFEGWWQSFGAEQYGAAHPYCTAEGAAADTK